MLGRCVLNKHFVGGSDNRSIPEGRSAGAAARAARLQFPLPSRDRRRARRLSRDGGGGKTQYRARPRLQAQGETKPFGSVACPVREVFQKERSEGRWSSEAWEIRRQSQ